MCLFYSTGLIKSAAAEPADSQARKGDGGRWFDSEDQEEMSAHKFRIGQIVTYRPDQRSQDTPAGGVYMIIARLPTSTDGQFEYRIRNLNEQHERVAKESELRGR